MAGSAIGEVAAAMGHEVIGKSSRILDLTDRAAVYRELYDSSPDALIIAAAKVGGISANLTMPVEFLSTNIQIQTNLLDGAHEIGINKVLFLGSSCIYPRLAPQPIVETALLTGELEQTNQYYAIAKIAGLKLVEAYRRQYAHCWVSAMPTNLYGPRDDFNLETAHVLPALIHRIHNAKVSESPTVEVWGDGSPLREFLHVEDLAHACLLLINEYDSDVPINIGTGVEISIKDLAILISRIVGYSGEIMFKTNRPNGTPRKLLDSSRILNLGWKANTTLIDGITSTYSWFLRNYDLELRS